MPGSRVGGYLQPGAAEASLGLLGPMAHARAATALRCLGTQARRCSSKGSHGRASASPPIYVAMHARGLGAEAAKANRRICACLGRGRCHTSGWLDISPPPKRIQRLRARRARIALTAACARPGYQPCACEGSMAQASRLGPTRRTDPGRDTDELAWLRFATMRGPWIPLRSCLPISPIGRHAPPHIEAMRVSVAIGEGLSSKFLPELQRVHKFLCVNVLRSLRRQWRGLACAGDAACASHGLPATGMQWAKKRADCRHAARVVGSRLRAVTPRTFLRGGVARPTDAARDLAALARVRGCGAGGTNAAMTGVLANAATYRWPGRLTPIRLGGPSFPRWLHEVR